MHRAATSRLLRHTIHDANEIEHGAELACELAILGAGAAGIAIALQFLQGPQRVILI